MPRADLYTPRRIATPEPEPEAGTGSIPLDRAIGLVNQALAQSQLAVSAAQRDEAVRNAIGATCELLHMTAVSLGEAHNDLVDRFNNLLADHLALKETVGAILAREGMSL